SKGGTRNCGVGDILCLFLNEILDEVGQELKLLDQMRELRRLDLGQRDFDHRQFPVNLLHLAGSDSIRAVAHKFSQFSHGATLTEAHPPDKPGGTPFPADDLSATFRTAESAVG